jgi:hypothetical protein
LHGFHPDPCDEEEKEGHEEKADDGFSKVFHCAINPKRSKIMFFIICPSASDHRILRHALRPSLSRQWPHCPPAEPVMRFSPSGLPMGDDGRGDLFFQSCRVLSGADDAVLDSAALDKPGGAVRLSNCRFSMHVGEALRKNKPYRNVNRHGLLFGISPSSPRPRS